MIRESQATRAQLDGLMAWWTLAGVDSPVSENSVNWLKPKRTPSPMALAPASPTGFPHTLDAFHDFLAHAADLPEAGWPGHRVLPAGSRAPRLMILTHAPDPKADGTGTPFDQQGMTLLSRMIRAIGLAPADCYWASLSLIAPASGMIDPPTLERLIARMRHHVGLVAPTSLLLVGDQVNRVLGPTDTLDVTKNLPFVNHSGGIVTAAAVAHPRLMLAQPMAKAGAWQALRDLVKGWGQ